MGSFAGSFSDHHLARSLVAQFNTDELIVIPNVVQTRKKLTKMIEQKQATLLTDFDFTLSKWCFDGQECDGSFTIFRNPKFISKSFMKYTDELLAKYHPIQTDKSMPQDLKQQKMEEWWKLQFTEFTKEKVKVADCDEMIASSLFYYRNGIKTLIRDTIYKHKIPFYIISAGFGILIEESLQTVLPAKVYKEMISSRQMRIYANTIGKDKNGSLTQLVPGIVHSCNKHTILEKEADSPALVGNVIIMGDRLHDLDIVKNLKSKNILKIGFYNKQEKAEAEEEEEKDSKLKLYKEHFDIVFINDGNLDHIAFLLDVIHSGGKAKSLGEYQKVPGSSIIRELLS